MDTWVWLDVHQYIALCTHQTKLYRASELGISFGDEWKHMAEKVDKGDPDVAIRGEGLPCGRHLCHRHFRGSQASHSHLCYSQSRRSHLCHSLLCRRHLCRKTVLQYLQQV